MNFSYFLLFYNVDNDNKLRLTKEIIFNVFTVKNESNIFEYFYVIYLHF